MRLVPRGAGPVDLKALRPRCRDIVGEHPANVARSVREHTHHPTALPWPGRGGYCSYSASGLAHHTRSVPELPCSFVGNSATVEPPMFIEQPASNPPG